MTSCRASAGAVSDRLCRGQRRAISGGSSIGSRGVRD